MTLLVCSVKAGIVLLKRKALIKVGQLPRWYAGALWKRTITWGSTNRLAERTTKLIHQRRHTREDSFTWLKVNSQGLAASSTISRLASKSLENQKDSLESTFRPWKTFLLLARKRSNSRTKSGRHRWKRFQYQKTQGWSSLKDHWQIVQLISVSN